MAMKTEAEVQAMLQKFDDANDAGELDCDGESVLTALLWVLGNGRSDADMDEFLEEM